MSALVTYAHPEDVWIKKLRDDAEPLIQDPNSPPPVDLRPGMWVTHGAFPESLGVLVASTDDELLVLWSTAPDPFDEVRTPLTTSPLRGFTVNAPVIKNVFVDITIGPDGIKGCT